MELTKKMGRPKKAIKAKQRVVITLTEEQKEQALKMAANDGCKQLAVWFKKQANIA